MKPFLLLIAAMICTSLTRGQYLIPAGEIPAGTHNDVPDNGGTQVPDITIRKGDVRYNHLNPLFTVNNGGAWLTQFNEGPFPTPFGTTSTNSDYFLNTGTNEIAGTQGIIVFDTVHFDIGAGNVMRITNTRQGEFIAYGEVSGGIMIGAALFFNNGITTTARLEPVNGAIVFVNNSFYSGGLTDVQHVDGFVSEINYPEGNNLPVGHSGDFTFPVGNANAVYPLRRQGEFEDALKSITVGWIDGDPNTTDDPTQLELNPTDPAHLESGIEGIVPVGFWDWHVLDATEENPSGLVFMGAGTLMEDQTITVAIPALNLNYSGFTAADLRLMGYDPINNQWIKLGNTGASGLTKGSTLSGIIPGGKLITAIAIGSTANIILPVSFISFTAKADGCKALLEWQTGMEQNNSHFNVERSSNGTAFEIIGQVKAAGNSNTTQTYRFTDKAPFAGTNYYRITQVDFDGKYSSTEVRSVRTACSAESPLKVYPNPARNEIHIQNGKAIAGINIVATNGQVVMKYAPAQNQAGLFNLNIQQLQNGIYLLQVVNKDGTIDAIKLLKQ